MPDQPDPWWSSTDVFGPPGGQAGPLPTGALAWGYPTQALGSGAQEPPRRSGLVFSAAILATALVAGGVGGFLGYRSAEHDRTPAAASLRDANASLGSSISTAPVSRPATSVAGIAARVLKSVVNIDTSSGTRGGTGSGVVLRSDGYIQIGRAHV